MKEAILLLGSNLGKRRNMLQKAIELIGKRAGAVKRTSSLYESEPWGFQGENDFLNQVIVIETVLKPESLLSTVLDLEKELGKARIDQKDGYVSRVIDIDILFYQDEIIRSKQLTLPHKLLHERKFTLLPLQELAGNLVHPVFNKTINQLLKECPDDSKVYKLDGASDR